MSATSAPPPRAEQAHRIPKRIHYCWFGGAPLPPLAVRCMESWSRLLPDYELIRWDESRFDVGSHRYTREAWEARKYAFVADYVRLLALQTQGGVYLDVDVEVVRPLDEYLHHEAFSGFETPGAVPTGIIGAAAGVEVIAALLRGYDDRRFRSDDGRIDMTTNVTAITAELARRGLVLDGTYQVIDGFALYPCDVFCPLDNRTGVLRRTSRTAAIHWFGFSWGSPWRRRAGVVAKWLRRNLGEDVLAPIERLRR